MLLMIPFLVQSIVILLDEFIFHIKRPLPKWERIGHPLDTLTVLICLVYVLLVPYSALALKVYVGLSLFSCIFVTKDEFVHKHHCPASEQWLHALLFINHPILLTAAGLIWAVSSNIELPLWLAAMSNTSSQLIFFLKTQVIAVSIFGIYQVVYWNFLWKPAHQ
ncbi:MAG: hypothetical protein H7A40_02435 [Chlamydiales bacterium]|nr:hypothetical protein [Chlamydiales bacterium]